MQRSGGTNQALLTLTALVAAGLVAVGSVAAFTDGWREESRSRSDARAEMRLELQGKHAPSANSAWDLSTGELQPSTLRLAKAGSSGCAHCKPGAPCENCTRHRTRARAGSGGQARAGSAGHPQDAGACHCSCDPQCEGCQKGGPCTHGAKCEGCTFSASCQCHGKAGSAGHPQDAGACHCSCDPRCEGCQKGGPCTHGAKCEGCTSGASCQCRGKAGSGSHDAKCQGCPVQDQCGASSGKARPGYQPSGTMRSIRERIERIKRRRQGR